MKIKTFTLLLLFSLPVTADINFQPLKKAVDHSHGYGHGFGHYTPVLTRNGFNGTYINFHGHIHHAYQPKQKVHKHLGHSKQHSHSNPYKL